MSFFKKLKNMVGSTGVVLDYIYVENPFPFYDPMIKATLRVKAEKDGVTILSVTGTFYAKRTVEEKEEELVLGVHHADADNCYNETINGVRQRQLPRTIAAGGETDFGLFVKDMEVAKTLEAWGVSSPDDAKRKGITFFLKAEVDVKETLDLFDPSYTEEISVRDNYDERQKWLAEEREYEEQARKERELEDLLAQEESEE